MFSASPDTRVATDSTSNPAASKNTSNAAMTTGLGGGMLMGRGSTGTLTPITLLTPTDPDGERPRTAGPTGAARPDGRGTARRTRHGPTDAARPDGPGT